MRLPLIAASAPRRRRRALENEARPDRQVQKLVAAVGLYTSLSLLLFGRAVVRDPTHRVVGDDLADKTLYMWSFKWWPTALQHAHNPLDVNVAWAPHGFDFGLGTAGGGLALAAAPLTSLAGPVATYNVLILAAPALASTSGFLLAHYVTRRFAPSLVGGYVFGFSSYELGHLIAHLPLAFVALVPLVPYLVLRRNHRDLSRGAFVACLSVVLVAQLLIVTQILFTLVILGTVAAADGAIVLGRRSIRRVALESGVALLVAILLASPIVAYAFVSDAAAPARSPFSESADVLNYVIPQRRTWLRPPGAAAIAKRFTGTGAEQGAYLGLPLAVLAALALVRPRRSRPRWLLAILLLAAVALSLGTRVKIAGQVVGIAPWAALAPLPIAGSALPARMTMYVALFAGLLVALALADRPTIGRWLLVVAGVAATLPNLQLHQWSSEVPRPKFFARHHDLRSIREGSTVLILPYGSWGWSMLWQAEAGFRFRIVGGHFALRWTPAEREWRDVYETLGTGLLQPTRLRSFLAAHGVDVVIVAPGTSVRAQSLIRATVEAKPEHILDTVVYRVHSRRTSPRPLRHFLATPRRLSSVP
jgi:hypothetical protein